MIVFIYVDTGECNDTCHSNASCHNSTCVCNSGFTQNGTFCEGKWVVIWSLLDTHTNI